MSFMFQNFIYLEKIWGIGNFKTNKVRNMQSIFEHSHLLKYLNLSKYDTSDVTDTSYMFSNCRQLKELNIKNFTTVCETEGMFFNIQKNLRFETDNSELRNIYYQSQKYTDPTYHRVFLIC